MLETSLGQLGQYRALVSLKSPMRAREGHCIDRVP